MKWSYKTYYTIIVVYLCLMVLSLVVDLNNHGRDLWYGKLIYYTLCFLHVIIDLTIIYTLKKFKENTWREIPFFILIAEEIIAFTGTTYLSGHDRRTMMYYEAVVMLVTIALCIYIFISTLFIKAPAISTLLKLYGIILPLSMILIVAVPVLSVFFRNLHVVVRPTYTLLFVAHTIPLLMLYIKLHNSAFRFREGDIIIACNEIGDVATGTQGTVIAKHKDMGYYEVEFFDTNGNLLNVLTVNNKDIEHIEAADLQARIDAFGSSSQK
jgi:hypothetical protein